MTPRVVLPEIWEAHHRAGGLEVKGGRTLFYVVNDAGGAGFGLGPDSSGGVVVSEDSPGGERLAIGARFSTDILTITPCTPDRAVSFLIPRGGDPLGALLGTARTAAWASFVFALRAAAAVQLAVELRELSAGVRFRWDRETSAFMPEGYLADAIENGAGFATHLAHEDMFPELLDHVRRVGEQWRGAEHLARRPGEIYRCLGFARSR